MNAGTKNEPVRTVRYVVPTCQAEIKGTVKVLRKDGNTAEAIPLYAGWIPQANGFAASPVIPRYRESPEGVNRDGQQMTKTDSVVSAP